MLVKEWTFFGGLTPAGVQLAILILLQQIEKGVQG
jgi:hypothetical protein